MDDLLNKVDKFTFKLGQHVMCNGYPGVIITQCDFGHELYEVRLPGGVVCVGKSEIDEVSI
jgi:hypothetical protein